MTQSGEQQAARPYQDSAYKFEGSVGPMILIGRWDDSKFELTIG